MACNCRKKWMRFHLLQPWGVIWFHDPLRIPKDLSGKFQQLISFDTSNHSWLVFDSVILRGSPGILFNFFFHCTFLGTTDPRKVNFWCCQVKWQFKTLSIFPVTGVGVGTIRRYKHLFESPSWLKTIGNVLFLFLFFFLPKCDQH